MEKPNTVRAGAAESATAADTRSRSWRELFARGRPNRPPHIDPAQIQRVTLLERPLREPVTSLERRVLQALSERGPLGIDALVAGIAGALYRDELRHGGWAAEIGFVGSAPFRADVRRAVEGATGILWAVERAIGGA